MTRDEFISWLKTVDPEFPSGNIHTYCLHDDYNGTGLVLYCLSEIGDNYVFGSYSYVNINGSINASNQELTFDQFKSYFRLSEFAEIAKLEEEADDIVSVEVKQPSKPEKKPWVL